MRDYLKANNPEYCNGDCLTLPYKFTDPSGNPVLINYKRSIGLKMILVKFTYPKGKTGRFPLSYHSFFVGLKGKVVLYVTEIDR